VLHSFPTRRSSDLSGVRTLQSSALEMSSEVQKAGSEMREEGERNLRKGMAQFRRNVGMQVKENQRAVSKIGSGAIELQGNIRTFQGEIHRYQEQDLKNFIRDFYYG
jgi:hypothetical protein